MATKKQKPETETQKSTYVALPGSYNLCGFCAERLEQTCTQLLLYNLTIQRSQATQTRENYSPMENFHLAHIELLPHNQVQNDNYQETDRFVDNEINWQACAFQTAQQCCFLAFLSPYVGPILQEAIFCASCYTYALT